MLNISKNHCHFYVKLATPKVLQVVSITYTYVFNIELKAQAILTTILVTFLECTEIMEKQSQSCCMIFLIDLYINSLKIP